MKPLFRGQGQSWSCVSRTKPVFPACPVWVAPGGSQKLNMPEHSLVVSFSEASPWRGVDTQQWVADKRRKGQPQLCALSRTAQHELVMLPHRVLGHLLLAPPQPPVLEVPTPPCSNVGVSLGLPLG